MRISSPAMNNGFHLLRPAGYRLAIPTAPEDSDAGAFCCAFPASAHEAVASLWRPRGSFPGSKLSKVLRGRLREPDFVDHRVAVYQLQVHPDRADHHIHDER